MEAMDSSDWLKDCVHLKSSEQAESNDIIYPYAWDEWVCRQIPQDSPALLHIWQHPKAFVLGLRDRQLPRIHNAIEWLQSQGFSVAVRNTGGAAVPLDAGVVNLSLVMPKPHRTLNFREDFQYMIALIQESLDAYTSNIQVGEIKGSYCPGDYDLSVNGMKFCGIAQRRQANGFVLQAFVNVDNTVINRAQLVRSFYDIAAEGAAFKDYPIVDVRYMASLQELVGVPSVQTFIEAVRSIIGKSVLDRDMFPDLQISETMTHLKQRYAIENHS
jgi:octanoyl-[GcvH]:protein N-octanoyltransferase